MSEWWGSRSARSRLQSTSLHEAPIPDCGFFLETVVGPIECYLEWDRGTETLARLTDKLSRYWQAESHSGERRVLNLLFVVPTEQRVRALVDAVAADMERRRHKQHNWFMPSWPLLVATTSELAARGSLAPVWRSLRDPAQCARLHELTARSELRPIEPARCLGRTWRKEQPDFWQTLSPLGVPTGRSSPAVDASEPEQPQVPVPEAPSPLERMREQLIAEARRDAQTATVVAPATADWTSSGIDGLMLDPDQEPALEEWR